MAYVFLSIFLAYLKGWGKTLFVWLMSRAGEGRPVQQTSGSDWSCWSDRPFFWQV